MQLYLYEEMYRKDTHFIFWKLYDTQFNLYNYLYKIVTVLNT